MKINVEFDAKGRGDVVLDGGRRGFIPMYEMINTIEACGKLEFVINKNQGYRELFREALGWLKDRGGASSLYLMARIGWNKVIVGAADCHLRNSRRKCEMP